MKCAYPENFEDLTTIFCTDEIVSDITESPPAESEGCPSFELAHKYYIPFLIIFGHVGNVLSILVFLTTHLKLRSSSYYLAALATADLAHLATIFFVYLSNETRIELFNKHGWCQLFVYVSSVSSMLSAWFTVAFTVERFIAVQYPLQRPRMCTVSRAKTITSCITIVAFFSHSYVFFVAGLVKHPIQISINATLNTLDHLNDTDSTVNTINQREFCDVRSEHYELMKIISIIDTVVSLFLPFVSIVLMNSMIVKNLIVYRHRFMLNRNVIRCVVYRTTTSQQQNLDDNYGEASDFQSNISRRTNSNRSRTSQQVGVTTPKTSRSDFGYAHRAEEESIFMQVDLPVARNTVAISAKNQQNITKLLLMISSTFILLNLPSYIIRIYIFFAFSIRNENVPDLLWCAQQTSMVLYYTNFSVNFLFYSFYGETFRRCLYQMIRKYIMNIYKIFRACFTYKKKNQHQQRTSHDESRTTVQE